MGRKIFLLILIIFLSVALVAGYFSTKLLKEGGLGGLTPSVEKPKPTVTPKLVTERDPITKLTLADGGGVIYELEGTFLERLEKKADMLYGRFVLRGDTSDRFLNIYLGTSNGIIVYGKYSGSFSSSVTWVPTPADAVNEDLKDGEMVKVRYTIYLNNGVFEPSQLSEAEEVFSSLSSQILEGRKDYRIPSDFVVVTETAGVIR